MKFKKFKFKKVKSTNTTAIRIIKKTNFLTSSELKEILYLKNTFWKYGLNSQFKWFKKYVKSNDYNFLLFLNNQ